MFDFGGHVGVAYHAWRGYLGYRPGLRWLVHDMPAIVRVGAELARERPSAGLEFTSDVTAGRGATVMLAAGSLQYIDESLPALLARIGSLPRHLIVNKLPIYDGEPFVTVQSTGRSFHPYRIYNRAAFVAELAARLSRGRRLVQSRAALRDPVHARPRYRCVQRLLLRSRPGGVAAHDLPLGISADSQRCSRPAGGGVGGRGGGGGVVRGAS